MVRCSSNFFNIYIIITAFNLFNSIFFSQPENDSSSFSPDGHVIIYSDNKILSYSIAGRTIVDSIKYLYDKKVIAIDLHHEGNTEQVLWMLCGLKTAGFMLLTTIFTAKA